MKYYVRTTGERVLHNSFKQIDYEILLDEKHELMKLFPKWLLQISDDDVVLLEDDIVLCDNFKERIEKIINEHPNDIINFFETPTVWYETRRKIDFTWNQCTYIPKDKLKLLGEEILKMTHFNGKPTPEGYMRDILKRFNIEHIAYRPCLVQHIDFDTFLNHRVESRRTPYFIDYLDKLNINYEDANKFENRKLLEQEMNNHIEELRKCQDWFSIRDDTILIVGYGVVGHNLAKEIEVLKPDIYDKFKTENNTKKPIKYNYVFICVDTPYIDENNVCDISQIENVLQENNADLYIIKSTILPGTVDMLKKKYNKHIIFSPEYYGGTQHCNNFDFNFTILGGEKEDCRKVIQLLQNVYDARHTFRITDSKTAELVKYMENSYLGMKVAFCCQFYNIAEQLGISYEELRELFILDERVNPSHTFVYSKHPYYQSHCLDKDIPAIANFADAKLLKSVIKFNEEQKQKF